MSFLLDTNVIIYFLKGVPSIVTRILAMKRPELAIPSIVAYEIEYGTLRATGTRRREIITRLLNDSRQVPFNHEAAREAARIRLELDADGPPGAAIVADRRRRPDKKRAYRGD